MARRIPVVRQELLEPVLRFGGPVAERVWMVRRIHSSGLLVRKVDGPDAFVEATKPRTVAQRVADVFTKVCHVYHVRQVAEGGRLRSTRIDTVATSGTMKAAGLGIQCSIQVCMRLRKYIFGLEDRERQRERVESFEGQSVRFRKQEHKCTIDRTRRPSTHGSPPAPLRRPVRKS